MRALLVALFLALSLGPAAAIEADEMFADPALEERARDLGRQLRCVKCRNQSIFDSNAGIAHDMRVAVRDRISAGDTDAEVLAWLQERYGDYVLLKPRITAQTLVLWSTPLLFLLLSGLAARAYLRGQGDDLPESLSAAERDEARALLAGKGE